METTGSTSTSHLVVRNTLYLTLSQVLAMPLSIFTMAIAAQYLGPETPGHATWLTGAIDTGQVAPAWTAVGGRFTCHGGTVA